MTRGAYVLLQFFSEVGDQISWITCCSRAFTGGYSPRLSTTKAVNSTTLTSPRHTQHCCFTAMIEVWHADALRDDHLLSILNSVSFLSSARNTNISLFKSI